MSPIRVKTILFVGMLFALLPLHAYMANTADATSTVNICDQTLQSVAKMVTPAYSSMAVNAGDAATIPLSLHNELKTPLGDVHLFLKITRLSGNHDIVVLRYDPHTYMLAPGEVATTSIVWATTKDEIPGLYRVDIYAMPNASYMNGGLGADVNAPANVIVNVNNKTSQKVMATTFDGKYSLNGMAIRMKNAVLFDEFEPAKYTLRVINNGMKATPVVIKWNIYPDQQVSDAKVLYQTSATSTVAARSSSNVVFDVPILKEFQYLAVAEIVENGQHSFTPIAFYRASRAPLPVSIFGVMGQGNTLMSSGLKKGETYTLFACPQGMSTLGTSTLTLRLVGEKGETLFSRSIENLIEVAPTALVTEFVSPSNIKFAQLILQSTSGGTTLEQSMVISQPEKGSDFAEKVLQLEPPVSRGSRIFGVIGILVIMLTIFLLFIKRSQKY